MRHYELMVILNPDLEEKSVGPQLDQFLGVIRDGGGTVEKVDIWVAAGCRTRSRSAGKASTRSSTSLPNPPR